ncbi:hypothetical protein BO443_270009 [Burkholderia orbicola]
MKKRFTEEQIIGFLREAEAGLPIKDALSSAWLFRGASELGASRYRFGILLEPRR